MISPIGFTPFRYKINFDKKNLNTRIRLESPRDEVCFTGKSAPSNYNSVFDYLASEILGAKPKKYGIDGSGLSATKIEETLQKLSDNDKIFQAYPMTDANKIKWKSYIPQEIREGSVQKINEARFARMQEWRDFLEYPSMISESGEVRNLELISKIRNNQALKLVVWNAVTSELKENNRHLPVPFDEKALLETIKGFEEINPRDRQVRCSSPSFLEMYTHRLRDNLLTDMNLSEKNAIWVKIPSIKHDPKHKEKNISNLETLSCKNWCTRSSVDKAEAALQDGDFFLYLKRGKSNLWEPLIGMASARGKIDQIQGVDNDNIVPINLVDEIKSYISDNNISCHYMMLDEGPKAGVAIKVSEKLSETNSETNKTLYKAIKEKDNFSIFKSLGIDVQYLANGNLVINSYHPSYLLDAHKGITIPYSAFGINEDSLLKNVEIIDGNLVLCNKRSFYNSGITKFPPNLEVVSGKVICNEKQFEKFKDDIARVLNGNMKRCIIRES